MKKCIKCNEVKPLPEFHKHKHTKDGRIGECKLCSSIHGAKYRKNNPEKIKIMHQIYNKEHAEDIKKRKRNYVESNQEKVKKASSIYRSNNVLKIKAHNKVGSAIKNGSLNKPSCCAVCKELNAKLDAHHCDYDKPLDIIWMCHKCHSDWHLHNIAING